MDKQDKVYNNMLTVLSDALKDLERAVEELQQPTVPSTPMPRPKFFQISKSVIWPYLMFISRTNGEKTYYDFVTIKRDGIDYRRRLSDWDEISKIIMRDCKYQPSEVLRSLRRIQAATEWCRRRVAGRRRAVEEILRQQQKAVEALEVEAAMNALKG